MEESGEEYELVPHKRVKELEKQVRAIKADPIGSSSSGTAMKESMDNLSKSMTGMVNLFKDASEAMKLEEKESDIVARKIDPMAEKIDTLIEQNKKIAKGILAVADMVQEFIEKQKNEPKAAPVVLPPGPAPPMMAPSPMIPQPRPVSPPVAPLMDAPRGQPPGPPGAPLRGTPPPSTIPPPPGGPQPPRKKGLFG